MSLSITRISLVSVNQTQTLITLFKFYTWSLLPPSPGLRRPRMHWCLTFVCHIRVDARPCSVTSQRSKSSCDHKDSYATGDLEHDTAAAPHLSWIAWLSVFTNPSSRVLKQRPQLLKTRLQNFFTSKSSIRCYVFRKLLRKNGVWWDCNAGEAGFVLNLSPYWLSHDPSSGHIQ